MINPEKFRQAVQEARQKDRRYAEDAYYFINQGVLFSAELMTRPEFGHKRHLSGPELCNGIRDFALSEFGPMAFPVLSRWGVRTTLDIGHVIFNLIDAKVLIASAEDRLGDFDEVFDLRESLEQPYLPSAALPELSFKIDRF
jgi:uncharacterized repeat protein (TIGR04138 family)